MLRVGTKEYERAVHLDQLRREGPVGERIAYALSVKDMTPNELITSVTREPHGLASTEENLQEIFRIINDHERLLRVRFRRGPENLTTETVLSL